MLESEEIMSQKCMRRFIRTVAWVAAGGTLLATSSCSLAVQDAVVGAFANFVSEYLAAILQRLVPSTT